MGDEGPRNRRFYHRIFQLGLAVEDLRGHGLIDLG
jgi:hypothetical protein